MSKTPRTEEQRFNCYCANESHPEVVVSAEFAEKLEQELAEANHYLRLCVTQCNLYIPLRENIMKHLGMTK